jgi:hypothetical protein
LLRGIHLTLLVGPAVAVPAPRVVVEALVGVQVTAASGEQESGFQLDFELNRRSPLHTLFLLAGGASIPLVRVVLVATLGGAPVVLIDGVMTHHQTEPGSGGGPPTLRVQGKDLSAVLGYFDVFRGVPYPAMPPVARAAIVLARYAWLGLVPRLIPSVVEDIPNPLERIPRQQGKDLDYVRMLAREVGYVFYVEPGPAPGVSFAYWGPEIRVGVPQPALNVDMDAHTNVESLSFRFDKEAKELPVVFVQEPATKAPIPIPVPDITPLNPPLGLVPPLPPKVQPLEDTAHMSVPRAIMRGLAYASQHADCVFASGSLDVLRYGRVLRSRGLVGVRGAGPAFDGLYYVKSVTSTIKRGEFKQSFELARNALLSTVPAVPP